MKRLLLVTALIFVLSSVAMAEGLMVNTRGPAGKVALQTFVPDPAKSQVNTAMTGTITFKKGTGATVNVTGWSLLRVDPTADSTYYYNTDTTKTYPIRSGMDNLIPVQQLAAGQSAVLVLGSATASVQGM